MVASHAGACLARAGTLFRGGGGSIQGIVNLDKWVFFLLLLLLCVPFSFNSLTVSILL